MALPRRNCRGLIEVAEVMVGGPDGEPPQLPRRNCRGLIEVKRTFTSVSPRPRHFRGVIAAASLKCGPGERPAGLGIGLLPRRNCRGLIEVTIIASRAAWRCSTSAA